MNKLVNEGNKEESAMKLLDQADVANQVKALEEAMKNNTGEEPSVMMWWELDKLKAAVFADYSSWLGVVKYFAMISGESCSDVDNYNRQDTWKEYFDNGYAPEEAFKEEKSYQ